MNAILHALLRHLFRVGLNGFDQLYRFALGWRCPEEIAAIVGRAMNRTDRRREDKLQRGGGRQTQAALALLFQEGRTHHQAGRLSEAARLYETVLEQQPDHAEAAHLLGLVAYRSGRFDEACELIRRAIRADGSQSTYHFNLGVVSQRKGAVAEAEEAYREAITRFPRHVDALVNLGNLFECARDVRH